MSLDDEHRDLDPPGAICEREGFLYDADHLPEDELSWFINSHDWTRNDDLVRMHYHRPEEGRRVIQLMIARACYYRRDPRIFLAQERSGWLKSYAQRCTAGFFGEDGMTPKERREAARPIWESEGEELMRKHTHSPSIQVDAERFGVHPNVLHMVVHWHDWDDEGNFIRGS